MLTEDFEKLIKEFADDGKLGGVYMAMPTGEVLEEDKSFIEVMLYEKSFFAKPCMSFGSYNVPNKEWLDKYKDEIFVCVAFENGNPAHPVYLGVVPREGKFPEGAYPNAKYFKSVEFRYTINDTDKKFNIEKINGDGSVAHSIAILDKKTIVSNSDNKIEIDYATNTIILKNKKGQSVVIDALTILGKGTTPSSAVLGEKMIALVGQLITALSGAMTNLSGATVVVNPTTMIGTFNPSVITSLAGTISTLAQIQGQLTTCLSSNVKLD